VGANTKIVNHQNNVYPQQQKKTMTKQVTFDIFAGMLYSAAAALHMAATSVKLEVEIGAAFLASILSCISSQPGDVILTDTYKSKVGQEEHTKFTQVVSDIYTHQGFGGFFAGMTARFVHVGAIITSQLVLYDIIKQMLGLPATGSH
jgi:solute carrier family 25 phosphate transporter 3